MMACGRSEDRAGIRSGGTAGRTRVISVILALFAVSGAALAQPKPGEPANADLAWTPPDPGALPADPSGDLVRRGRDIFTATYASLGPHAVDPARRYAGNDLACQNCHLQGGTKRFGLPVYGLAKDFPQYSARSGAEITLADRINSCMTRSMNGRAMPAGSPELGALVAYLTFLSSGLPPGRNPDYGAGRMAELDRAADPDRGAPLFRQHCVMCHGEEGQGLLRTAHVPALGYMVPPVWGTDSFNAGAGMNRLITLANYLHDNMPHGTDYETPRLSAEEAWDIAAYVLAQPRPRKAGESADFPNLLDKPVDTPYGPYADAFAESQHRFGPFAPIRAAIRALRETGASAPNPNR
ncbi:MAG: c-type cytochrome [Alsobacter sp.]